MKYCFHNKQTNQLMKNRRNPSKNSYSFTLEERKENEPSQPSKTRRSSSEDAPSHQRHLHQFKLPSPCPCVYVFGLPKFFFLFCAFVVILVSNLCEKYYEHIGVMLVTFLLHQFMINNLNSTVVFLPTLKGVAIFVFDR